ncbi:hypothetical protein OROGR_001833 [Orobanche gracilis]
MSHILIVVLIPTRGLGGTTFAIPDQFSKNLALSRPLNTPLISEQSRFQVRFDAKCQDLDFVSTPLSFQSQSSVPASSSLSINIPRKLCIAKCCHCNNDLPPSVDWREHGAVSEVEDQGWICRSCWAFAAVGAVESLIKIKTGILKSLSVQELLDCIPDRMNCRGGFSHYAFDYIAKNGIATKADYRYRGEDGQYWRRILKKRSSAKITGYKRVDECSEDASMAAVAKQPVCVVVNDTHRTFFEYKGGIYKGEFNNYRWTRILTHYMLCVGYGVDAEGTKYWILKNSTGKEWGEMGYMRMLRDIGDKDGLCGIAREPTYPIFEA